MDECTSCLFPTNHWFNQWQNDRTIKEDITEKWQIKPHRHPTQRPETAPSMPNIAMPSPEYSAHAYLYLSLSATPLSIELFPFKLNPQLTHLPPQRHLNIAAPDKSYRSWIIAFFIAIVPKSVANDKDRIISHWRREGLCLYLVAFD